MAKTLPELISEANYLTDALIEADGETTDELEELFAMSGREIKAKLDCYGAVIDGLKSRQEYAVNRMKQWESLASGCDRALDNIKTRIKYALSSLEMNELHGFEYTFKVMPNPPSVIIDDETKIPGEFITHETKTITKISKKDILDAIKDGRDIPGAHVERSTRLVTKVSQRKEIEAEKPVEKNDDAY